MISILTGNDDARLLANLDANQIAEKWKESLSIDVGEDFRKLDSIDYMECRVTGFRWYSPATAAGGSKLYEQLEKFDWYYMQHKWEFSQAIKLLKGGINYANSLLEIGIGEGNFLRLARDHGFEVQGVELNPRGAERARALGFKVHELTLEELSEKTPERFDAICSFQVLEHVPDPRSFLQGMIHMLRPGGRLILSVPNAAVMRKIDPNNKNLLNQPPHHLGHWDEKTFRALEKILPIMVRSVHREPLAIYHIAWMVTGYLRNLLHPLGETIPRLLVNRYTILPLELVMRKGLHRFFPGHTLLVELEYQAN